MTVVHGLAARYLVGRDDVAPVELAGYLGITKQSTSEVVALLEHSDIVRSMRRSAERRPRISRTFRGPNGRSHVSEREAKGAESAPPSSVVLGADDGIRTRHRHLGKPFGALP